MVKIPKRPQAERETPAFSGAPNPRPLARAIRRQTSSQKRAFLRDVRALLDAPEIDWSKLGLDRDAFVDAVTPVLTAWWEPLLEAHGKRVNKLRLSARLDPIEILVSEPRVKRAIEDAAFALADSTLATTKLSASEAIAQTKAEMSAGMAEGEAVASLNKRLRKVFTDAEKYRINRIAQTESARALHASGLIADQASGVVVGYTWLSSSGACPKCLALGGRSVRLGDSFAYDAKAPAAYASTPHPPLHPHCGCTVLAVLRPDLSEEPEPSYTASATADNPEPIEAGKSPIPEQARQGRDALT